jgi:mono/diheme cytochrome c family protein
VSAGALCALLCASSACELGLPAGAEPHRELNRLDMADQPKLKPQRGDLLGETPTGMLAPPVGSVATDEHPYPFTQAQAEQAGAAMHNPLQVSPEVIARGKWTYENLCITCHGSEGAGDGHLTKLFPKPPSLMTQKLRDWSDGRIFHLPMRGQGSMPSHVSQLETDEIWEVILYIRSLQQRLPVAPPAEADKAQPAAAEPAAAEPAAAEPAAGEGGAQ